MKLLFITASLNSGGSERVMSLLANMFSQKGNNVEIVCLNKPVVFYQMDEKVTVSLVSNILGSNNLLKKAWWLRKHVSDEKPDAVIAFMTSIYCMTLLSLFGLHIPVITSERIDPNHSDALRKLLRMIFLPLTAHHIVQTEQIKAYYPKFIRKKTSVIFNPVRDEVFSQPISSPKERDGQRNEIQDELQVQGLNVVSCVQCSSVDDTLLPKMNRIISVGRLTEQKNQKMMIQAFAKVSEGFPDWQLVILGEGPLRSSLELLVKSLQLEGRVLMPGRTEHVIDELRKSKVFCLSSDFEGMSNAMIEAICVGLPIVTTNVSGVSELVEEGKGGYMVPCGDVDQLAQALQKVMSNNNLQKTMADYNLKKAAFFKLNNIVDQWEQLILQVIQKSN